MADTAVNFVAQRNVTLTSDLSCTDLSFVIISINVVV